MGNHPSAVVDDGESPINRQAYTVRGNLHARAVMASTVNASAVYARRITCQTAQISRHESLDRNNYPNPPHRNVTAHTVNADVIYADEINCKTLRCYEVHVGDGEQWRAKRVQYVDRNSVGWDGREDDDSEPSDDEYADGEATGERSKRKKALAIGFGGALAAGLGGAAFAYFKHKHNEKEEKEKEEKEKQEREERDRKEKEELRKRQEEDDRRRLDEESRRKRDDEDRRRREDEDRCRREEDERRLHAEHQVLPSAPGGHHHQQPQAQGNFHQTSRNIRLWSDGNHCFLIADCDAGNGAFQESRIDLDQLVAPRDGEFAWVRRGEAGNFSGVALRWEVRVQHDGAIMEADLPQRDGSVQRRGLNLTQFIRNRDGHLVYTN